MDTFFEQRFCEFDSRYSLITEDDGRVCYAYLMENNKIVGDVWLYNAIETPEKVDWLSKDEMPFLNPQRYVDSSKIVHPIRDSVDLTIDWLTDNTEMNGVDIYIRSIHIAMINIGSKPGWSTVVSLDGPLAKVLR